LCVVIKDVAKHQLYNGLNPVADITDLHGERVTQVNLFILSQ